MSNQTEFTYTTAPADYDYHYVRDFGVVGSTKGSNPKPIRKVLIQDESRADYQKGRYASGLHMVVDQKEFDKLVSYDLVEPA